MRILEILILATVPPTILGFLFQIPSSWTLILVAVTTALIILHLFIEGYRWQMIPAYVLSTILLLIAVGSIALNLPAPAALWRIVGTILGLFFFTIAVGLPLLFPIFQLPAPTGPYSVGTTLFNVLDHTRKEISAKNPNDDGDVVVQAWYPTDEAVGKPAAYLANGSFPWDWLRLVPTHAVLNAPVSSNQASYPVLTFAHGGGFMAVQNSIQMQEFASHGYIILSISHIIDSVVTIYPDGHTDGRSLTQAWKDMKPVLTDNNNAFKTAATLKHSNGGNRLSIDEKRVIMQQVFEENRIALQVINRRANDAYAVIDYLEKLNQEAGNHLLSGRLDMDRLGILGHSNGGAVAVNVAMNDSRIKAVINMDGYIFGDVFNSGLQQPFMSMNKEGDQGRDDVVYEQIEAPAYSVTIQGANHFNFMDIYLWMPLFNSRYLGSINPQRAVEIVNRYTLAFFEKHLRNQDDFLLGSFGKINKCSTRNCLKRNPKNNIISP